MYFMMQYSLFNKGFTQNTFYAFNFWQLIFSEQISFILEVNEEFKEQL